MTTADHSRTGADTGGMLRTAGLVFFGAVVLTALYGPTEYSERAFRLMPWLKAGPEPAEPPVRRRTTRQE